MRHFSELNNLPSGYAGKRFEADTIHLETVGFAPVIGRRNTISIAAYILAGGYSRRFGTDNALFKYQGQPVIEYLLRLLHRQFDRISIIAKKPDKYIHLEYPVFEDIPEQQSPLVESLRTIAPANPSLREWLYTVQTMYLDFSDSQLFINLNRIQDRHDLPSD